jgi:hypothetical protein
MIPFFSEFKKLDVKPGTVTHICNPSDLGGGDQEDHGPRPAQAKSL